MRHLIALAVKLLPTAAVLALVLPLTTGPITVAALAAYTLGVGIPAYLLGDLLVLPRWGQLAALAGDVALAAFLLYFLPLALPVPPLAPGAAISAAVALSLVEFFFHRYVQGILGMRRSPAQE